MSEVGVRFGVPVGRTVLPFAAAFGGFRKKVTLMRPNGLRDDDNKGAFRWGGMGRGGCGAWAKNVAVDPVAGGP